MKYMKLEDILGTIAGSCGAIGIVVSIAVWAYTRSSLAEYAADISIATGFVAEGFNIIYHKFKKQ